MAGIVFSKSSGLNDSIYGKSAEPIMMLIEKRIEAFEQASMIKRLFKMAKTKNFAEKFTGMTGMDNFEPVGEGGKYSKTDMQESYQQVIEPETWKSQFFITREMVEDNKVLNLSQPAAFAQSYHRTREQLGAKLFVAAVLGKPVMSGKPYKATSADGKFAFATDHPAKKKGPAQSNKFSNAFSVDALSAIETAMQNFSDDNGNVLAVAPDTIIIPNDGKLKKEVFAAIGADKDPNTSNNAFNYQFGRWNVVVWPYLKELLAGADRPYILLDSGYNDTYGGAVWLDRHALDVKTWIDNNNDNNVWNGYARFMCGFVDWRAVAVGGVTGGTALTL